jgi:starvation-inducible DNA-binding protein
VGVAHPEEAIMSTLTETTAAAFVNIGIEEDQRERIADALCHLLADTYTLYLKTQNFHWNVTGPGFHSLHLLFEKQYQELALAVDEVAERIRALGFAAPATFRQFEQLSSIPESAVVPPPDAMVRQLRDGHEAAARTARGTFDAAEEANDQATADLLSDRMRAHEKAAWFLRSLLE